MPLRLAFTTQALRAGSIIACVLMMCAPAYSQSAAAIDRFIGSWKEDESKAQLGGGGVIIFRRTDAGQLEELRGGQVNPQVQPVVFDGKQRQVDPNGRTVAWTRANETTFRRVSSDKSGRVFLTRTLRLSSDGQTLTEENLWSLSESGGRTATAVFQREQGEAGLIGTWRMKSYNSSQPEVLNVQRAGNTGLKFLWPLREIVEEVTLTGKPAPMTGPNIIGGTTVSTKLLPDGAIEETDIRNGEAVSRFVYAVSPDGRTMTHTVTGLGKNATGQSSVYVFVKQ